MAENEQQPAAGDLSLVRLNSPSPMGAQAPGGVEKAPAPGAASAPPGRAVPRRAPSPPLTNRGVLNTEAPFAAVGGPQDAGSDCPFSIPDGAASASIDWLEWTAFDRSWDAVSASLYPGEWAERGTGALGYLRSWGARDAVAYTDGQPGMGVHVKLTGRAVAELARDGTDPVDWWSETQAADSHLTRLDVAWDDIAADGPGLLDVTRMRRELEAGHVAMRAKRWEARSGFQTVTEYRQRPGAPEITGETLYFGRRGSNTYIRIYDKRAERLAKLAPDDPARDALPAHWVRVEMELRHEAATKMLALLREGGWPAAAEVLRGYLDFRVPAADSNRSRWDVAPWWAAFTGAAATASLGLTRHPSSTARQAAWVQRQVAATVAVLVDAGGGTWLRNTLDEARRRPRPGDARRMAEAEAWFRELARPPIHWEYPAAR